MAWNWLPLKETSSSEMNSAEKTAAFQARAAHWLVESAQALDVFRLFGVEGHLVVMEQDPPVGEAGEHVLERLAYPRGAGLPELASI